MSTRRTATTPGARGYVLIVVLLLGALIVATTTSYARHVTMGLRQSTASLWVHESRESAQSGVAFARQVLASGQDLGAATLVSGGRTITVTLEDRGGDRRALRIDALSGGLGATLVASARVYAMEGTRLPTLADGAVSAVAADPALTSYSGTVTVQDAVLTGTLRLDRNCRLTLRNVVLHGSIVSQAALAGPPYDSAQATTLTLQEGVRIEPTAVLPGCAILLPDGAVVADASSRFEVHGVVLADSLSVAGRGVMDAQVLARQGFALPGTIDRPGLGRAPLDWPAALEPTALGLRSLAFEAADADSGEISAIQAYAFTAD